METSPGITAVAEWLQGLSSEHTRAAYQRDLTLFTEWMSSTLGHTDPRAVTIPQMRLYSQHRTASGDSNKTLSRRLSTLSSLYAHLIVGGEDVPLNPADWRLVRRPSSRADKPTPTITAHQLQDLYNRAHAHSPRSEVILALCGFYGLRASEVGWLRLGDLIDTPNGCHLSITGKGRTVAEVPVDQDTCDALAEWLQDRHDLFTSHGLDPDDPDAPLVVNLSGPQRLHAISRHAVTWVVGTLSEEAFGVSVSPHVLRKSTAYVLYQSGMSPSELKDWGRWRSLSTVQIYIEEATTHTAPALQARELIHRAASQPEPAPRGGSLRRPTTHNNDT